MLKENEKMSTKNKILIGVIVAVGIVALLFVLAFVLRPLFSLWSGNYSVYINTYNIETFEIPEGTTRINEKAFEDCISLKSIIIPSSIKHIGKYAFDGCNNLQEIHITDIAAWCSIEYPTDGNGISNPLDYGNLYLNGTLVKDFVVPSNVTKIGNYAFYGYDTLSSITIQSSVKSIGKSAFSGCGNLTNVTLSEGLETINHSAFANCKRLTKIIIPKSVITICGGDVMDEPFYGCDNLTVYCRDTSEPYGWTGKWDVYAHQNYGKTDIKLKVVWGYTGD